MQIIICDIDNTVLKDGHDPMNNVIGWLHSRRKKYKIYFVTGRLESYRKHTEKQLKKAKIDFYDGLIMNNKTIGERVQFKYETAIRLNKDGKVAIAVENDEDAREAYKKAGIKLVYDPMDLSDDVLAKDVWGGSMIPRNGIGMI